MGKIIYGIKEVLLSVLFPKSCPVCDGIISYDQIICEKCVPKIHFIEGARCKKCSKQLVDKEVEYCSDCGKSNHIYKSGIAAFLYDDVVSKSIYRFKYHNRRTYAEFYGSYIAKRYGGQIKAWDADVIIPVPIHQRKMIKRGYNQAELIARELAKNIGIPVDNNLLIRVVNTKPQKEMTKAERKKNLEKAFKIATNVVEYNKVILVDDIYTTGSTIDECARILRGSGVSQVYFVSLSIGAGI